MPRLPLVTLAGFALALGGVFATGCGSAAKDAGSSTQPKSATAPKSTSNGTGGTSASQPAAVQMKNVKFVPETIKVKLGQKITWTNKDGFAHNVTSTKGEKIDSGNIDGGATFQFTPKQAGTIAYECTIHPGQSGTISVTK